MNFVGFAIVSILGQKSGGGTHMWDIRLKAFFESFTYEHFLQHKQLQTLTVFIVCQSQRHHLRSCCDLCETLHPSPVPENLCAFQKREPTFIYSNPCLYLELGGILPSGHALLDLYMHPS